MTSRDNFGTSDAPGPPPPSPPFADRNQQQPYKFSQDELKVLSECNRESFFQRCIPLGTILGVATYYGVQTGYLKRSPKWGATPKVVVVSILSYFLGKLSYQQKCAEKFMQLPNSRIGAILRQRKKGGVQESLDSSSLSLMPFSSTSPSDTYSDVDSSDQGFAATRPDHEGLDDSQRPSLDNNPVFEEESMPPQQHKATTYEELRKQNRDDFQKQRTRSYKEFLQPDDPAASIAPAQRGRDGFSEPAAPNRTNKYGDVFD